MRTTSQTFYPMRQLFRFWIMMIILVSGKVHAQTTVAELRAVLDSAAKEGFSGVLLVAREGKPLFYEAVGYRHFEQQIPLQKNDIVELASLSKQFTAMIILMLQERGKLGLDDSLSAYVKTPYPGITIRHLLNHTSGLPDYQAIMDQHWDKQKVAGNTEILAYLNQYAPPAEFAPGTQFSYSNTGYVLLASVAEAASGADFIQLCRRWIFKPLRMKDTDIRTLAEKAAEPRFAAGHLLDSSGSYLDARRFHAADYTVWLGNRKGPGRISSTAADLLLWDKALYTEKLVKKATLEAAFTPVQLPSGERSDYGFGWFIQKLPDSSRMVMHTGDNPGYANYFARKTGSRETVILLNNNGKHPCFDRIEAAAFSMLNSLTR